MNWYAIIGEILHVVISGQSLHGFGADRDSAFDKIGTAFQWIIHPKENERAKSR
jgi:hypothetical protein